MGHSIKRKEDPRFIRRQGHLRGRRGAPGHAGPRHRAEPHAHAKIVKIHTAKALAVPGVPRGDHGRGPRQVRPALDADPHVGHPDGPARGEGHVPGAGGGRRPRHRRYAPPTASRRWQVDYESAARRRGGSAQGPGPRRSRPAHGQEGQGTITSGTGNGATGRRTDRTWPRPTSS